MAKNTTNTKYIIIVGKVSKENKENIQVLLYIKNTSTIIEYYRTSYQYNTDYNCIFKVNWITFFIILMIYLKLQNYTVIINIFVCLQNREIKWYK